MATTNMRIVIRRDTSINWTNVGTQVVLLAGEQGYETDTGKMKIGNGQSVWNDLPYYTGGITDIDHDTIIMDAAGVIMLNEDSVIGNIEPATNVKEYVDVKDTALSVRIDEESAARKAADSVESAAREAADTALGARIDQEIISRGAVDSDLQVAIAGIGDRVVILETDPTTKAYVDSVVGQANDSISDVANDFDLFKGQTQAEFDAQGNMIVALQVADTVESAARIAGDDSIVGLLGDSVTALEAADDLKANRLDADLIGEPTAPVIHDGGISFSRIATLDDVVHTASTLDNVKANAADVYTQTEVDAALALKADADTVYTQTEVDTALALKANAADVYTQTEVDTALALKADAADVYTQTEVDDALALKANAADVYTQTEVDTALALKADAADVTTDIAAAFGPVANGGQIPGPYADATAALADNVPAGSLYYTAAGEIRIIV